MYDRRAGAGSSSLSEMSRAGLNTGNRTCHCLLIYASYCPLSDKLVLASRLASGVPAGFAVHDSQMKKARLNAI